METEIFTCKYFQFGRNTTGLSQSHLRNFLACSINHEIIYDHGVFFPRASSDELVIELRLAPAGSVVSGSDLTKLG